LKAGLWFRLGLFVIVSPDHGHPGRLQADNPLSPLCRLAEPPLTFLLDEVERLGGAYLGRFVHGGEVGDNLSQRNGACGAATRRSFWPNSIRYLRSTCSSFVAGCVFKYHSELLFRLRIGD